MSFLRRGARWFFRFLLGRSGKIIAAPIRRRLFAFEAATHDPRALQQALLERILRHQADTGYGRDHRFQDIRTLEDFRRQVPIAGYEGVESYIERMRRGDLKALVADEV